MKHLRLPVILLALVAGAWGITRLFAEPPLPVAPKDETVFGQGYYGFEPLQARDGAVDWDVFAAVKEHSFERSFPDGSYTFIVKPEFTDAVRAMDGKEIRLMGYMFPLEPADQQARFLFGPYPPSCPFHYHVNSNQVIQVVADPPLTFTYDPIALTGTLRLLESEDGLFYTFENAKLVKVYEGEGQQ